MFFLFSFVFLWLSRAYCLGKKRSTYLSVCLWIWLMKSSPTLFNQNANRKQIKASVMNENSLHEVNHHGVHVCVKLCEKLCCTGLSFFFFFLIYLFITLGKWDDQSPPPLQELWESRTKKWTTVTWNEFCSSVFQSRELTRKKTSPQSWLCVLRNGYSQ